MLDLSLERETLRTLLERNHDAAAWAALKSDGWLDAVPDEDGGWSMAGVATAVADVVARSGRALPVGAHLAAAAALAAAGDGRAQAGTLGVLVDVRHEGDQLAGRLWGDNAADAVLVSLPDGGVGVCAGADLVAAADPVLLLADVAVATATVPADQVYVLAGGSQMGRLHDARIAYFLAVEALAGVEDAFDRTLAYARERRLFGTTLGSLQVVQHRLVDMRIATLMGRELVSRAAAAWAEGDGAQWSWPAKALAGTKGVWAAEEAIQLHGGIGFTWEIGLHRVVRRSQRARLLLGGPARAARETIAAAPLVAVRDVEDWSLRFDP